METVGGKSYSFREQLKIQNTPAPAQLGNTPAEALQMRNLVGNNPLTLDRLVNLPAGVFCYGENWRILGYKLKGKACKRFVAVKFQDCSWSIYVAPEDCPWDEIINNNVKLKHEPSVMRLVKCDWEARQLYRT